MKVLTIYAHPNPESFCNAVLNRFNYGLKEAGHQAEVVDLYKINFNPVYNFMDQTFFADGTVPERIFEKIEFKKKIIDKAGGPLRRFLVKRWIKNKSIPEINEFMGKKKPKDILIQQEKISNADGLAFISPVYWLGFPAIMKGWFERVFTYGFAFHLNEEGWEGSMAGRIPLLNHDKAVIINTTFFDQVDYEPVWNDAMKKIIDQWGLSYPGIKKVEHHYFYSVPTADFTTRENYLEQAYQLGLKY